MKISIVQMSLMAVLACSGVSAALPQEELRPLVDAGWAKMMTTRNPRTGVVAGCDTRKSLPPPDATNNLYRMYKGRPGGWGPPGVGDAPLICGTALSGLVDKWNVTHDASVKDEAAKVAQGVLNLAVLHGYKGFVCRGFCSDDKTTVSLSSRDQYTHWIHGLWRYTAAKDLADPAIVAAYRQRVVEVAAFMEERVTEAHEWNFGLADSPEKDYRGICTMWGPEVWPHEAARLPMIYCAAYLATGDVHWRDLYETFIDEALDRTLKIKEMTPRQSAGPMPCYSLFQANTSFEPILAYEKNPARVAKIHEAMNAFAHHARLRMKAANPDKPPYGMCWDGELALTQLMAPDLSEASEVETFVEAMIRRRNLTTSGVCRAAHVMAAYWRIVSRLSPGGTAPSSGPGTYFVPEKGTANVVEPVKMPANAQRQYTVAFLGGSITEMHGFRPRVMKQLRERYPNVAFTEIAAGLSSTCSDTGAFRLEEDLLSKGRPDVFIVEAAVNDDQDGHFDRTHCIRGMEGTVRHVLEVNPACAVVVGLMVNRGQYEQLMKGKTPVPYAAHADVARHYGAAVADVGSALVASAKSGGLDWAGYKDCHPSPAGCDLGAKVVLEALATVFDPLNPPKARQLPPLLDAASYAKGRAVPPSALKLGTGWQVSRPDWKAIPGSKRGYYCAGPAIWSETPDAVLSFSFTGSACGAFLTAGPDAGDLEVVVDGGSPKVYHLRADYGQLHYPYTQMLADGLAEAPHMVQLRVRATTRKGQAASAVRIHRLYVNGEVR